jgi:hypothetical protein
MTVTNIIKGLQLINKSKPEGESDYHFRAEHDEVWAGSLDWPMPNEDEDQMKELGWERDKDTNGWRAMV